MKTHPRGMLLVEVILATTVFGLIMTGLAGGLIYGRQSTLIAGAHARAAMLAQEGVEVTRTMRDASFSNLTDGTHGLEIVDGIWAFSGSSDTTDVFLRQVIISSIDADHKNVTSTVTWQQDAARAGQVMFSTVLTNWRRSTGDWANPTSNATTTPISCSGTGCDMDLSGNQNGVRLATQGNYAYMVRQSDNSNFSIVDVSSSNPTVVFSMTLPDQPSDIYVAGKYAYVSSKGSANELEIIDVSNPAAAQVVSTLDLPGSLVATAIAGNGQTTYITALSVPGDGASPNVFKIDTSNAVVPVVTGSLSLGGYDGLALTLLGSHVYVAESLSGGNTQNMVAIDTNAMQVIGTLSLEATAMHFDMAGFGSTVLIGQNTMLFVVDVSNPMSPVSIGTGYSAGGVIEDLVVNSPKNTLVFLGTNSQEKEFQVVSLASLASPVIYSWYNVTGESTVGGVLYDPIRDLVYSDVTSTAEEFVIFSPYF